MGPKLGHEAGEKGTIAGLPPQSDSQYEEDPHNTHVDSTDPFRLLIGTKSSPFFPYRWFCTSALAIGERCTHCRPDNNQSDRVCSMDVHG